MKKKLIKRILGIILYIILLILCSSFAILYASGYRYRDNHIVKVSVIHLVSDPSATVILNERETNLKSPSTLYLEPGDYEIELQKEGYFSYFLNTNLESGSFVENKNIALFKKDIIPQITSAQSISPNKLVDDSLVKNNSQLFVSFGHEIWNGNHLVTRLSETIINADFYNDYHILYQTETKIGVISIDGKNNVSLFKYSSTNPLKFSIKNRGQVIEARDADKVIRATIK